MKKQFLRMVGISLFCLSLLNIEGIDLVYAANYEERKVYITSQKVDYIKDKSKIEDFYSKKENVIENEIIVKYKEDEKKPSVFSYFWGKSNNKEKIQKIKVKSKSELDQRLNELQNDPNIEYIQPNYKYKKSELTKSNQYNSVNAMMLSTGVSEKQWYMDSLGIPGVWTQSTGAGVKVAVLDTGIDTTHEDLQGKVIGGKDFTNSGSYMDDEGHGTAMAGIIAADRANGIGVSGIAYDAKILSVKVLDSRGEGDTLTTSEGIKWAADNGAKILNLSLGGDSSDPILEDAVNYAVSKGCVIIAASGNDGVFGVGYPAAYNNVIAVGATDEANQWSNFSNYGDELDVVAPGVNIYTTAPKSLVYQTYNVYQGTSPATAVVSGQVSLILSKQPQLTVSDVLKKIKDCSFRLAKTYPDIFYGQGVLDVSKAITGVDGTLNYAVLASKNDNTIGSAREITSSTSFSDSIASETDANWYKLYVPSNTVAKIKFSSGNSGLSAEIYRNDHKSLENIMFPFNGLYVNEEYYVSNYFSPTYYYVKIMDNLSPTNSWNTVIEYKSITDPVIPKIQSLKYSIDTLKQDAVVTENTLNIGGWALCEDLIGNVKVKIDNEIYQIENGVIRQDVFEAFPEYYDIRAGFNGTIDLSQLAYGKHTLTMVFTDMIGAVTSTNPITFTIADTLKYSIDNVKPGMQVTSNSLPVGGWALSKVGIAKVEAVVDNDTPVELKYGTSRIDVYNAFKDYNNMTSGFGGNLDIRKYGYGTHSLRLKLTYLGGRTAFSTPVNFTIVSTLITSMDTVREGSIVMGTTLGIGGWALSKAGISKVEAIIDNNTSSIMTYGATRMDVYNAFKGYNNSKAGFNGTLDVGKLSYGEHYLKLRITEGNTKVTVLKPVKFIVQSPIYSIDTPINASTIAGNTLGVGGWVLSKAGIQKVEVLVDGVRYKELQYGINRPDVYNVFKEYNNQNSGFNGTIDISKLPYGIHHIQLKITDKVGRVNNSKAVSVNIADTKKYAIDSPQSGKIVVGNTLNVAGWVLSKTGVVKVEALVDGVAYNVQYGINRLDVYNAFKDFNNKSSGFIGTVDVSKLSLGNHSLVMRFTDARGQILLTEVRTFSIQKP
ncbi:S8 family peptidase [Clostridium cellulovorans]|uniref:Peptidase S8 and S53 subtilisin kexin sedolisin n=1 Tax=Clostridium cellulovorans (strain ATCC 35296 / DSM 3052 / OCM 3 / 743B) TaxID=573061 RepID=D9SMB8_CLOC7|nr:S8 family serine peptidase [Clostridium cellulovorans]ADL53774.1 peptidase S8 and S53 subtilisin kexin sedolisin [Clostridium cellulovorans 743B]